jgi:hypothetical protein
MYGMLVVRYKDYDEGLCPAFLSRTNPEAALAPVCTSVRGAQCDRAEATFRVHISHMWAIAQLLVTVSFFGIYLMSLPGKIQYFRDMFKFALNVRSTIKKDE